jgi:ribosome biogenesis SPOUT family RNA methylase Rps3
MQFCIEHFEENLSKWVEIEYKNMISVVGNGNLMISSLDLELLKR